MSVESDIEGEWSAFLLSCPPLFPGLSPGPTQMCPFTPKQYPLPYLDTNPRTNTSRVRPVHLPHDPRLVAGGGLGLRRALAAAGAEQEDARVLPTARGLGPEAGPS